VDLILLTYVFPSLKILRVHDIEFSNSPLKEEVDAYSNSTIHEEVLKNLRKISRLKPTFLPIRKGISVFESKSDKFKTRVWNEVEGIKIKNE
jgi:hypothetical protein